MKPRFYNAAALRGGFDFDRQSITDPGTFIGSQGAADFVENFWNDTTKTQKASIIFSLRELPNAIPPSKFNMILRIIYGVLMAKAMYKGSDPASRPYMKVNYIRSIQNYRALLRQNLPPEVVAGMDVTDTKDPAYIIFKPYRRLITKIFKIIRGPMYTRAEKREMMKDLVKPGPMKIGSRGLRLLSPQVGYSTWGKSPWARAGDENLKKARLNNMRKYLALRSALDKGIEPYLDDASYLGVVPDYVQSAETKERAARAKARMASRVRKLYGDKPPALTGITEDNAANWFGPKAFSVKAEPLEDFNYYYNKFRDDDAMGN